VEMANTRLGTFLGAAIRNTFSMQLYSNCGSIGNFQQLRFQFGFLENSVV